MARCWGPDPHHGAASAPRTAARGDGRPRHRHESTVPAYLAHPHSPWVRGSNENLNRIVRKYFSKGVVNHLRPEMPVDDGLDRRQEKSSKVFAELVESDTSAV